MKKRWKAAAAALAGAVLLSYLAAGPSSRGDEPRPAPEIALPDLAGKTVRLSDLKGRIVLLDFWATWCKPCREETPELETLQRRFSGRAFTVLGVALDASGAETVAPYARAHGVSYPLVLAEGEFPAGYPLVGIPAAYLIDRQGLIVRRYLGPKSAETVARDVEALLKP